MGTVEARGVLELVIEDKLASRKKTGNWDFGIPEVVQTVYFRLALLRAYHGRTDYERWQRERNPEAQFADEDCDDEMRFKIVLQPRLRVLPKIFLTNWESASLEGGALVIIYEIPRKNERARATHSLFLPKDRYQVILTDHRARGLRAKLSSLSPLSRGGINEIATSEDVLAVSEMLARASVFYRQNPVERRVTAAPNPNQG